MNHSGWSLGDMAQSSGQPWRSPGYCGCSYFISGASLLRISAIGFGATGVREGDGNRELPLTPQNIKKARFLASNIEGVITYKKGWFWGPMATSIIDIVTVDVGSHVDIQICPIASQQNDRCSDSSSDPKI